MGVNFGFSKLIWRKVFSRYDLKMKKLHRQVQLFKNIHEVGR
jgi:hypothetical protein